MRIFPYNYGTFERTAVAIASDPTGLLTDLSLQHLAYAAASFATSQHPKITAPMAAIGDEITRRMTERAAQVHRSVGKGS